MMIRKNVCSSVIMMLLLMMQSGYSVPPANTVVGCVSQDVYTAECGFNGPIAIAVDPTGAGAVYVVNGGGGIYGFGSVSMFDPSTNSLIGCVKNDIAPTSSGGFNGPVAIAITPNGLKGYVCNAGNNSISVIDLTTNTVTGPVIINNADYPNCLISDPRAIAIASSGLLAYVCNGMGGPDGIGSVSVIDVANNTVIGCVDDTNCSFSDPVAIAISGTTAYVCNASGNSVSVIDLTTNTVTECVSEGAYASDCGFQSPTAIAISGTKAYVCNNNGANSTVSIIDLNTNTVIGCITNNNPACAFDAPSAIAIRGTVAYVTNQEGNTVTMINLTNDTIIGCIAPTDYPGCGFDGPNAILVMSEGGYVVNFLGNSVSVLGYAAQPTPLPPTNGSGCTQHDGAIVLNWSAPASGQPLGYEIFDNPGLYAPPITTTLPNQFTYTVGLPTATTYYIVAFYANGEVSAPLVIDASDACYTPPHPGNFPPATVSGCKTQNRFLLQTDYINNITWTAPASGPAPAAYRVYQDNNVTITATSNPEEILSAAILLATVPASGPLQFYHHDTNPSVVYTYFIVPIDSAGQITGYNTVTVTSRC